MDDNRLENRLRRALRAEGDSIPLAVTADQLRLRLRLRHAERANRRLILTAAAALVLAVGAGAALFANRAVTPPVGNSPEATQSPTRSPSETLPANQIPLTESPPPAGSPPAASIEPVADIAPYPGWQTIGRLTGPDGHSTTTVSGQLPSGVHHLLISAACNGVGSLSITNTGDAEASVDCPMTSTTPSRSLSFVGDATQFEVHVTVSGAVSFQVLIEGSDAPLHLPAVVLRSGTRQAVMGVGCIGEISLAWGYTANDSCGTGLPGTPLETLKLARGQDATIALDGWTVTFAGAECGRITTAPGSQPVFEASSQCKVTVVQAGSSITISGIPRSADPWAVELDLTARNAVGDSFSGPFFAYVDVN